jgi:hypothetical protein
MKTFFLLVPTALAEIMDTWAVEATDKSWRLDCPKAVGAIEKGRDIAELRIRGANFGMGLTA